ncbi:MAG: class I SAM-dependent methyltransferase, partial [Thermoguttaceae bacterium]
PHVRRLAVNADPALDDLRWLLSAEAARLLDRLVADAGARRAAAPGRPGRLSAARFRLLLEQAELRRKGAAKFPAADRMFFLAKGLEQATDLDTARYKAGRFPAGKPVADLCCGIGGDLLALAERGPVTALDLDPAAILLAEANIGAVGAAADGGDHRFLVADAATFHAGAFAAWHVDPDRRATGRRTTQLAAFSPGQETIDRLLSECPAGAVKLAPATVAPEPWQGSAELEWIGRDRQCRQQVAWFGPLAGSAGLRRATVLRSCRDGGPTVATIVGKPAIAMHVDERIGRYVLEPDAAVLAADLSGALAERHGLWAVHRHVPYLSADRPVPDPLLSCFEVTDVLPFDRKRLRRLFGERGVGRLEIKTRGVEESPEQVRRDLRLDGDRGAVLLLARLGKRVTAIVAQRVD